MTCTLVEKEKDCMSEDKFEFPKEEERILQFWRDIDAFQTSVKLSKGKPEYTFYDGPPFATGLPHYGHILAGTIKDVVLRYASLTGHHVERRFGWDCHGLPVEYEIDKALGIKGKEDVMRMGIPAYNAECRKIVNRYTSEWERVVERMGRWIDFKNDWKTMNPEFMESVWWVFKRLFDMGQIYRGFRVMPYSTACTTPLSNFELALNYKDVNDPSVVVKFPLCSGEAQLLVWTTTPWTLPSNLAVCVNPEFEYVFVKHSEQADSPVYVLLECRIDFVFGKDAKKWVIQKKVFGRELVGQHYVPMFDFFKDRSLGFPSTFSVLSGPFVTNESGTGVVHMAPGFGEDDFQTCLEHKVITETDVPCPIDDNGRFIAPVSVEWLLGKYVKDADSAIIKDIESRNRLLWRSQLNHSYPFCWRSDTPLLYRAIPCWFVRVANIRDQMIEASSKSRWVPEVVQEKRFHNWLAGARDWAISRNRYWGTPIPIWANEDFSEVKCIGSVEELVQLSGVQGIKDLHRDSIDHITIPGKDGSTLKRVDEVLDCWFESGSVPYAHKHYPFENQEAFEKSFPADFIGEGLDQTRGWFYTLVVLGTHLFGQCPFRNLIVNGLVLAQDGKKMSKRLKNYTEPTVIMGEYGADALRLYLINSPVVRAESLKFKDEGVRNIVRDVMLPWLNAYKFLENQMDLYKSDHNKEFKFDLQAKLSTSNTMDKWILASFQSLVKTVRTEMAAYKLYAVVPPLLKFIDALTNWYIRFNRKRLKGDAGVEEQEQSLNVLFSVIRSFSLLMAPFTPFFAESLYQKLLPFTVNNPEGKDVRSVHFCDYPVVDDCFFDANIERAFSRLQVVVERVRAMRDQRNLALKLPLRKVTVVSAAENFVEDLETLRSYVLEELNVRELELTGEESRFPIQFKAIPNWKLLGQRLKKDMSAVQKALEGMSDAELRKFANNGTMQVCGHELTTEEVTVSRTLTASDSSLDHACESECIILLDITVDAELKAEGLARELANRIQRLRKTANLNPTDTVSVHLSVVSDPEGELQSLFDLQMEYMSKSLKQLLSFEETQNSIIISEDVELGGGVVKVTLTL